MKRLIGIIFNVFLLSLSSSTFAQLHQSPSNEQTKDHVIGWGDGGGNFGGGPQMYDAPELQQEDALVEPSTENSESVASADNSISEQ